jgi:hypothetical protein
MPTINIANLSFNLNKFSIQRMGLGQEKCFISWTFGSIFFTDPAKRGCLFGSILFLLTIYNFPTVRLADLMFKIWNRGSCR